MSGPQASLPASLTLPQVSSSISSLSTNSTSHSPVPLLMSEPRTHAFSVLPLPGPHPPRPPSFPSSPINRRRGVLVLLMTARPGTGSRAPEPWGTAGASEQRGGQEAGVEKEVVRMTQRWRVGSVTEAEMGCAAHTLPPRSLSGQRWRNWPRQPRLVWVPIPRPPHLSRFPWFWLKAPPDLETSVHLGRGQGPHGDSGGALHFCPGTSGPRRQASGPWEESGYSLVCSSLTQQAQVEAEGTCPSVSGVRKPQGPSPGVSVNSKALL